MQIDDNFKASEEMPTTKAVNVEHLESCRACNQVVIKHAAGVGDVYDDVSIRQMLDMMQVSLKSLEQGYDKVNKLMEHTNKMFLQIEESKREYELLRGEISLEREKLIDERSELERQKREIHYNGVKLGWKVGGGVVGTIVGILTYILSIM